MRDPDCGDCIHYAEARRHESNRKRSPDLRQGQVVMAFDPEIEDTVNATLEEAQQGAPSRAMDTLTRLWVDHPRHYGIAFGIGAIHAIEGQHDEALKWFDQAIAINPYGIEAHFNKATAHQKRSELAECARAYQKVIVLGSPDDLEVARARSFMKDLTKIILEKEGLPLDAYLLSNEHFNHGFESMQKNDWQEALKSFRASEAIHEQNASCHGNMAICLAYLGQKAEALAELNRALEINPTYQPPLSNRVIVEAMKEGHPLNLRSSTFQGMSNTTT